MRESNGDQEMQTGDRGGRFANANAIDSDQEDDSEDDEQDNIYS